jgi:DNA-binding response OmpR family regulator
MEPTPTLQLSNASQAAAASKRIVIVEDDPALGEIYKTRLELQGYTCFIAYNGIIALYFIQKELPDLVLLDLMIPDLSGSEVLSVIRKSNWGKDIPVYVISNLNETEAPQGLRELGIAGYSIKANMKNDDIDTIVNSILQSKKQN